MFSQRLMEANLGGLLISQSADVNYVFIMTFLLFSLGFLILFVMAGYRVYQVFSRPSSLAIVKDFYGWTTLLCAFSVCSSVLLVIESVQPSKMEDEAGDTGESDVAKLLYNVLYISDALFVLLFFYLFWFTVIFSYKMRVRVGDVAARSRNPFASNSGKSVYILITIVYIALNIVCVTMYNLSTLINSDMYLQIESINNMVSIFYYTFGVVYLHFKLSGRPFKSLQKQKNMQHIDLMGKYWLAGRVTVTVFYWVLSLNSVRIGELVNGSGETSGIFWSVISYFCLPATVIVSQVIPLIYALSVESVKIISSVSFTGDKSNREKLLYEQDQPTIQANLESQQSQIGSFVSTTSAIEGEQIVEVKFDDHSDISWVPGNKSRARGLGTIQRALQEISQKNLLPTRKTPEKVIPAAASNRSKYLAFRKLPTNSLSAWILDEISYDLQMMKSYNVKHLVLIHSIARVKDQLFLVSKFLLGGSLSDHVNSKSVFKNLSSSVSDSSSTQMQDQANVNKEPLLKEQSELSIGSTGQKIRIALQIARTLHRLHERQAFHGHLSSSNVLFDEKMNPYVSDFGLQSLKKYLGLKNGYSNKSYFTAPEHLSDKSAVVREARSKSDVYSFAFVLYELFMERQAFEKKLNVEELKKLIIDNNSRPKIDSQNGKVPIEIATIIRYCWLSDPQERPEVKDIIDNLLRILPQFGQPKDLLDDQLNDDDLDSNHLYINKLDSLREFSSSRLDDDAQKSSIVQNQQRIK